MILKATHNALLYNFFKLYTYLRIRTAFRKVEISGDVKDMEKAILVISNHFSWWDGFWVMYMNMKLFRRKFYFMMLEEQLRKHMFFNKTGGYSVRRGSRSVIETLQYTASLLNERKNMVLIFPQGEITTKHIEKVHFEKGVRRILEISGNDKQVIFDVNIVDYFSHAQPSLYMYLKDYRYEDHDDIERAYNEFYSQSLEKHRQIKD